MTGEPAPVTSLVRSYRDNGQRLIVNNIINKQLYVDFNAGVKSVGKFHATERIGTKWKSCVEHKRLRRLHHQLTVSVGLRRCFAPFTFTLVAGRPDLAAPGRSSPPSNLRYPTGPASPKDRAAVGCEGVVPVHR